MKESAQAASQVLDRLDQACRGLVITGCFDEIFFHGKPVLVGVEPHSMAWVLGTHAADRSASTWTGALQGFNALEQAVVDGGRGMQRGLADFQTQRKNAGNATPLQVSLDVFHTKQEAQRVLRKLWSRVESQWAKGEEADRQVVYAWRHGGDRRGFGGLVTLYWHVGKRIREEILGEQRAAYGEEIVSTLSKELTAAYGRGLDRRNLFHMVRFADFFPDEQIVYALRTQLSWTHFRELLAIDDPLKREFYAEMCRAERWSTRTLQDQVKRMVYERTASSKKPEEVVRVELAALRDEDRLTPDLVFRDPYFLDLPERYRERDLEQAILRELEAFLLELGTDFTFVARQKRISVDYEDYYLDWDRMGIVWGHTYVRHLWIGGLACRVKVGILRPWPDR